MGVTKTDNYNKSQVELATLFKVLGHPARVAILQSIIASNPCICGDLVTEIGLAQSTISQHLKELKSVGLIKGSIEGNSVCYCINTEKWNTLKENINQLLNSVNCSEDNCC